MSIDETHNNPKRRPPLLSVIIPVYNAEKFLEESVNSVRSQTLKDLEILLVNDCSTDHSGDVARQLAKEDSRIKVFDMPENRGPGIARNVALDYADGDYCTFMDSDDLLHPEAYSSMVCFAINNQLDIVRCEMGRFSDENRAPRHCFQSFGEERIYRGADDLRQAALSVFSNPVRPGEKPLNFGGSACSAIFHRSLFEQGGVRYPRRPHMLSEDFIFCFQTLIKAKSIGLMPRMFYYYRENRQSRTRIPRLDILDRAFATAEYMQELIQAEGFPEKDKTYALGFAIDISRAFVKNILLSSMSLSEKKKWFEAQSKNPIIEQCAREYPLDLMPRKFRVNFETFHSGNFWRMMMLVRAREALRTIVRK